SRRAPRGGGSRCSTGAARPAPHAPTITPRRMSAASIAAPPRESTATGRARACHARRSMSWPFDAPSAAGPPSGPAAGESTWVTASRPSSCSWSSAARAASAPESATRDAAATGSSPGSCAVPMALVMPRSPDSDIGTSGARLERERRVLSRFAELPRSCAGRRTSGARSAAVDRACGAGDRDLATLGSVGPRLLLLPHDEHVLTVHLDGAPVGRRFALRLGSSALPPLPQLLLQVLEHPLLRSTGVTARAAGRRVLPLDAILHGWRPTNVSSARARLGLRSLRSALASICRMRSRVTAKRWPTSSSV